MNGNDFCQAHTANLLLVEGKKDCRVVSALQEHHHIVDLFGIFQCNGEDGVLRRLNALIPSPLSERPAVIGVVLDADTETVEQRWQQLAAKLNKYQYVLPNAPVETGTIVENEGHPKVGIWLMPDNKTTGMLEDFLLATLEPRSLEVAKDAVKSAQDAQVATFKQVHLSKATIHTYLAWQDEPGAPVGLAITAQILSIEGNLCRSFVDWLRRLFS